MPSLKKIITLLVLLTIAACSPSAATPSPAAPEPASPTAEAIPEASETPAEPEAPPSETPLPTDTPLPTITPTPNKPTAYAADIEVNCRAGYSVDWKVVGSLFPDNPATITGTNPTRSWWYVTLNDGDNTQCWVKDNVVHTGGNLDALPIVEQKTAEVVAITIAEPETIIAANCEGPIDPLVFGGTVEMDGPGTATWRFTTEQAGVITDHATDYLEAKTKTVGDSFTPRLVAGTYWVTLSTISPNAVEAQTTYTIECP